MKLTYATNLKVSCAVLFLDLVATAFSNTFHLEDTGKEDIANIVMISVHGVILMVNISMVFLSVSGTVKFKAGLFGELFKLTYKPLLANMMQIGVMPMPWVYRRWVLHGSKRYLYWDDTIYRILAIAHIASVFIIVYQTTVLHLNLTHPSNYNALYQSNGQEPTTSWLIGLQTKKFRGGKPAIAVP